jgi:hypothetical protein
LLFLGALIVSYRYFNKIDHETHGFGQPERGTNRT